MNLDAELETEGVGPVFGSAKKWGFEPWQHRRSCLGQGAVFGVVNPSGEMETDRSLFLLMFALWL